MIRKNCAIYTPYSSQVLIADVISESAELQMMIPWHPAAQSVSTDAVTCSAGTATSVMDLNGYPFAQNMRIHDGVLYFIYPTGLNHRKALYQVRID